ncbi:MAG: YIP1 family protein [Bacilli bacterium]
MKKDKVVKQNLLKIVKNTVINPIENMDENIKVLDSSKKTLIFALIMSGIMTVLNLLNVMISAMFVRKCDFWTGKCKTKFIFGGLDNLDYAELIFKYLFMYALFAFGIALVYYIGALIIKKNANYIKLLAITLVAIIPNIIASMIIGPIVGSIYGPMNSFISIAGTIYSILILTFSLKNELKIGDIDKLTIYNIIVIMILHILHYYIFVKLIFM